MRCFAALPVLAGLLFSQPAQALDIVQITNISDFDLGNWGIGDPPVNANIDICIYATLTFPVSSYGITVSGNHSGYFLKSGSNQIPFTLTWDDGGAGNLGGGGTAMTHGVKLANRMNANILAPLCTLGITGPTARLKLHITQAAMIAAPAGTYTGVITLLLTPT